MPDVDDTDYYYNCTTKNYKDGEVLHHLIDQKTQHLHTTLECIKSFSG